MRRKKKRHARELTSLKKEEPDLTEIKERSLERFFTKRSAFEPILMQKLGWFQHIVKTIEEKYL